MEHTTARRALPYMSLIERFAALFRGRGDVYAKAFARAGAPGKVNYTLVKEPLTYDVLQAHFNGEMLVGQYCLLPDSTCHWFALDFDADDDTSAVMSQAYAQLEAFESAGLLCYLEQSRSGDGVHLWGFFNEPVLAEDVRAALKPLLVEADSFDRLYPVQTTVTEGRSYGNLIALPFFGATAPEGWSSPLGPGVPAGASVFLNHSTLEPMGVQEFLETAQPNVQEVVAELIKRAPREPKRTAGSEYQPTDVVAYGEVEPKGRPEQPINGVLKMISDFGCRFMAHAFTERRTLPEPMWYAALQQLTCFKKGREAAHLISRDHPGYTPQETDAKFTQALRHPPVGCRYIHEHFPDLACKGCPMKAPYHMADVPIRELVKQSAEPLQRSDYKASLERMRRRNAGAEQVGVTWGTAGLDDYTRLRPKELTVVGASPSIGKTALLVDAATSLAKRGTPVFIFSAETSQEGVEDRLLANMSGVDSRAIRGERRYGDRPWPMEPDEVQDVERAAEKLAALPIYVNYTAANADLMLNLIEDAVLRDGIHFGQPLVIMFDYLQFTSMDDLDSGMKEYERLSRASQEFKYLAKILRHPVVLYSQLRRDTEGDDEPEINWFKGTGRIEADADVALILTGERIPGPTAKRKLSIVKQREGEAGVAVEVLFYQAISKFDNTPSAQSHQQPARKDLFSDDTSVFGD